MEEVVGSIPTRSTDHFNHWETRFGQPFDPCLRSTKGALESLVKNCAAILGPQGTETEGRLQSRKEPWMEALQKSQVNQEPRGRNRKTAQANGARLGPVQGLVAT